MIVNSAKRYREWFRDQEGRFDVDIDFIGCSINSEQTKVKGFYNAFHGKKDDIAKHLPSLLDMAEDNQAIYEFLQNAVDCGATHFWAFYNDDYFLAVNNGEKFSIQGISSLLNIAQSPKDTASSIGRLGIGFKLVHRLVGKGNGTKELIYENKGPVLFSWDKNEDLSRLMSSEFIEYEGLDENPHLFKIAITNFPTNGGEVVKDVQYKDTLIFPDSELLELRQYTRECLNSIYEQDPNIFKHGSLFFIKLGENKKELLDSDLCTLRTGIEYSMNTLRQLNSICFNGENIVKKQLTLVECSISKESTVFKDIEPQYDNYDILYSFGYLPLDFSSKEYIESVQELKKSPNFYKYFPMGDEVDKMALFIHSDSFQIEANRRSLSNHHTNRGLLPVIANKIVEVLRKYKSYDKSGFLRLYASILLTDRPDSQEKISWMNPAFYDIIYAVLKEDIPTRTGYSSELSKIKIKKTKIDLPLDKLGIENIEWFYWSGETHKDILACALDKGKVGLEEWNINDIIENANITALNDWLNTCDDKDFDSFIAEINSVTSSKKVINLLPSIKLFRVGEERKSRNEIVGDNNCIITSSKVEPILSILTKIGIKCTNPTFESHPLCSRLNKQNEKNQYQNIKSKLEDEKIWNTLTASDKLKLIVSLSSFEDVGDSSIKSLKIFKNMLGSQCALGDMVEYKEPSEEWEKPYIICYEENFTDLKKYLVASDDFFSDIVERFYSDILCNGISPVELYEIYEKNNEQWKESLGINIIKSKKSSNDVLLLLERISSKATVEEFVRQLDVIALSSQVVYDSSSLAYRYIKLAAKEGITTIRNKITIDGVSLTSFSSSNDLTFKCKIKGQNLETLYKMRLSDILPDDTQCAIYGKVAESFSTITNYKTIFSANSSDYHAVSSKLDKLLKSTSAPITAAQFIFILFTRWQVGYSSFGYWLPNIRFSLNLSKSITEILCYAYENGLTDVLVENQSMCMSLWLYSISNKYLFANDYTLPKERGPKELEDWCGQDLDKRAFLKRLKVHFEDSAEIKRRKLFKENNLSEWEGEQFPQAFLSWVSSLDQINGDKQQQLLLSLVDRFKKPELMKVYIESNLTEALELDTAKYQKWKSNKAFAIYRLDSNIPCQIVYDQKQTLFETKLGCYKYFPGTRHLYIKGIEEETWASSLAQVYPDSSVPFEYTDYTSILLDTYEEQVKKDRELLELRQLRDKNNDETKQDSFKEIERKEYEERIRNFLGGAFNLQSYVLHSEHIISCFRILRFLEYNGYKIAEDFDQKAFVSSGKYEKIKLQNGKYVNVSGAKWGIWYIHPNVWRDMTEHGNWACVCTGNNENDFKLIKSIDDLKEIAQLTNNVLIKLHQTRSQDMFKIIGTVFPGFDNQLMDIHLMFKLHDTPNQDLNSLFDKVFEMDGNNFKLD